jgi:hypothetical protein
MLQMLHNHFRAKATLTLRKLPPDGSFPLAHTDEIVARDVKIHAHYINCRDCRALSISC